jgi:glycosyltransferase involved in cell wall biosynthesis
VLEPAQGLRLRPEETAPLPDARPTIAQIVPNLDAGGAEVTTVEVTEAIVKAGGRALVVSTGGRLAARIIAAGGEIETFPAASKNPARILWNGQRLKALAEREGVSLLHARSRAPAWSALLAARSLGLPLVTTYHGAYRERGRLKNLYNGVMARGDVVIANSGYTARSIKSRYGKAESEIATIYRGVDLARFLPTAVTEERVAQLRRRWGIVPSQRVILHAARLSPLKGQAVVIEAARLLSRSGAGDDVVFVLAGDAGARPGYAAGLKDKIRARQLEGRVRLVGHLDDMPAGLATAQLALMVSIEPEGFGRVAVEAQAMGCPVIASAVGALPEAVRAPPAVAAEEATGWLVKPGDAAALAEAIRHALALPEAARRAMGQRARAFVGANYSVGELQRQTLAVYDRLLGTRLAERFAGTLAS